jgi:hypothetical protein
MKKISVLVGTAFAAASIALAGPAAAASGGAVGGISPDPSPVASADFSPAAVSAPSTGGSAALADASAGPGGAGSSRPASSVCTQDINNSGDGAAVNALGTQSAYNRTATDGNTAKSMVAVPQWKVSPAELAVPSS